MASLPSKSWPSKRLYCKCWLSKNYRKQTLDVEGSSETLASTPLTLQLGKLVLKDKGDLEVADTETPKPKSSGPCFHSFWGCNIQEKEWCLFQLYKWIVDCSTN